ncbi:hypothetical protein ABKN59_002334 [Abortiporus biennis]
MGYWSKLNQKEVTIVGFIIVLVSHISIQNSRRYYLFNPKLEYWCCWTPQLKPIPNNLIFAVIHLLLL